ncbi:SAM-dependent RNA methyltransferase [Xylariaceae sp. FL0804]|nr:SAM-dependent RNA methyltransferase [Xylariaceae sp. FL0804]
MPGPKTYVVEHLDPELGPWSALEYVSIARETHSGSSSSSGSSSGSGSRFVLSSLPPGFDAAAQFPPALQAETARAFRPEHRAVEDLVADGEVAGGRARVCLLDPRAGADLGPEDGERFDVFLFGGILDRTSELRAKGFEGRRLGPVQMTTDTAVRVTRMVVEEQYTLETVPYLDFPELKFSEHESTQMPFRYVKGEDGKPIMPEGMLELIKKDADKSIDDLF